MILRPSYIEAIAPFIDQPLVKILAGVRRCGKSTIFEMLADELRRRGVPEDRIIKKRYTEMDIPADISAKDMYDDLKLQIQGKDRCYLLLDEIQEVKGWEKTVNSQLKKTAKEHSNIHLVDWNAQSKGHASWFAKDRVHMGPEGNVQFTRLLLTTILKNE